MKLIRTLYIIKENSCTVEFSALNPNIVLEVCAILIVQTIYQIQILVWTLDLVSLRMLKTRNVTFTTLNGAMIVHV